ncbi:MAG: putative integral membrane protein [Paracoccaceae bacterium]|jgi:uncharacterized integral membrane protein
MRYIRYAFLGCLGIILVSVSIANRALVEIRLIPDALGELIGFNMGFSLPLFVVILLGIAAGLVIGFIWEWLREYKQRRTGSTSARTVRKLEREVTKLKGEKHQGKDEVLVILEEAS